MSSSIGEHANGAKLDRVCGGWSMVPTIQPGDSVHLAPPRPVRSGDVIVLRGGGDYEVVHRLLFKVPFAPYLVHRGDAVNARVGLARWESIVGVADLPRRRISYQELTDACVLIARRGVRRLLVGDKRRQRSRE